MITSQQVGQPFVFEQGMRQDLSPHVAQIWYLQNMQVKQGEVTQFPRWKNRSWGSVASGDFDAPCVGLLPLKPNNASSVWTHLQLTNSARLVDLAGETVQPLLTVRHQITGASALIETKDAVCLKEAWFHVTKLNANDFVDRVQVEILTATTFQWRVSTNGVWGSWSSSEAVIRNFTINVAGYAQFVIDFLPDESSVFDNTVGAVHTFTAARLHYKTVSGAKLVNVMCRQGDWFFFNYADAVVKFSVADKEISSAAYVSGVLPVGYWGSCSGGYVENMFNHLVVAGLSWAESGKTENYLANQVVVSDIRNFDNFWISTQNEVDNFSFEAPVSGVGVIDNKCFIYAGKKVYELLYTDTVAIWLTIERVLTEGPGRADCFSKGGNTHFYVGTSGVWLFDTAKNVRISDAVWDMFKREWKQRPAGYDRVTLFWDEVNRYLILSYYGGQLDSLVETGRYFHRLCVWDGSRWCTRFAPFEINGQREMTPGNGVFAVTTSGVSAEEFEGRLYLAHASGVYKEGVRKLRGAVNHNNDDTLTNAVNELVNVTLTVRTQAGLANPLLQTGNIHFGDLLREKTVEDVAIQSTATPSNTTLQVTMRAVNNFASKWMPDSSVVTLPAYPINSDMRVVPVMKTARAFAFQFEWVNCVEASATMWLLSTTGAAQR